MVTAIEYRAMALQHHRWAGMCRSPESREEHFRLEGELLAFAESEERLHRVHAPEQPSNPQQSKIAPRQRVAPVAAGEAPGVRDAGSVTDQAAASDGFSAVIDSRDTIPGG
jgi:hypothetical protein